VSDCNGLSEHFKRTLQTQVMCKCEFVALGGEGVGVAMGGWTSIPSTCLLKNVQMANVLDKVSESGKSCA
jgi:hypothetical protein